MRIQVVDTLERATPKGFPYLEVKYTTDGGPVKTGRVVSFGKSKGAFDTLKAAAQGAVYDIQLEQNGQYWNWVGAVSVAGDAAPVAQKATGRTSFETPEERASRQVYIIRQSSLSISMEWAKNSNDSTSFEDIQKRAEALTKFVLTGEVQSDPAHEVPAKKSKAAKAPAPEQSIEDDLPWDE